MIRNSPENCKCTENTITQVECTENVNATRQEDTDESKEDEDTGEKTGETKKRYRSEKQRERTRQYKRKIRIAKKQMIMEKKLAEKNRSGGPMTDGIWSLKQQRPERGSSTAGLLQTSALSMEPKSAGDEQVSVQLATEAKVVIHRHEDKLFDNMKDDSLLLKPQAPQSGCATVQSLNQEKSESENIEVDKKLSKERLAEQISLHSLQQSLVINLTKQAAVDADIHESKIPDNITQGDSVYPKQLEPKTECTDQLLPNTEENTKSEKTGVDKKLKKESLVEPTTIQLRPVIIPTTEVAVDEARHIDPIIDDNTGNRQDIFGILSVYVHSSIHHDYDKDPVVTTNTANNFEYVYFSLKELCK